MNKVELLDWYNSIQAEKMPQFVEAVDANNKQLFIDGEWRNVPYSWTLLYADGIWKYVETESERGYVFVLKEFPSEANAVEYAQVALNIIYKATISDSSREGMLGRYIQQKFGYSEKQAKSIIEKMSAHKDIIDEFFNYARLGKFCQKYKPQIEICGYTAEKLNKEYNLSPLGAYNYLVYLAEEPEHAIADLKAGLPRK